MSVKQQGSGARWLGVCVTLVGVLGGIAPGARAGEIESLLQRGLPASLDPGSDAGAARGARACPPSRNDGV